ncbi:phage tail tape measure protein [Chelatococcus sp. SYSU_G07232]|uniref:Phage tail tape measure protein n=1 Tax=Chelatococcus albus TaxID=3047466 RepID=A0ABT7AI36_9HYPH|nr:phage tail tape measure protein [Chelatococcus sp. SYSU_G07232]MDJ1159023.1 phage tail tape measure protein [Chelatococcus sp. SYSU_G07232]
MDNHEYRDDRPERIDALNEQLRSVKKLSDDLGRSLSNAFAKGLVEGRKFDDVLKGMGRKFSEFAARLAFKPLELGLTQALKTLSEGLFKNILPIGPDLSEVGKQLGSPLVVPNARGNVVARGLVQPFAEGGVVAAPTYFPLARGLGLMGELGAEAIMPLARGPDGRLGVRAAAGRERPLAVTVNVAASDVESFRRSEAQVAAAVARAVARGRRAL